MYVFSTTAVYHSVHPRDNLYMWGHYANGHRGVAIEFNATEITAELMDESNRSRSVALNAEDPWTEIDYVEGFEPITCEMFFDFSGVLRQNGGKEKTLLHDYFGRLAKTKSVIWKDEHEWRLMWRLDETKRKTIRKPISAAAIEKVYIGMRASAHVRADVAFEMKQYYPNAKIFQAEKRLGAFALDFKPII